MPNSTASRDACSSPSTLFVEAWSTWEMHPAGDEIVYLLSGDVDVVLWTEDGERTVRVSEPGVFAVAPRGN